jgi:cysteinyl-tRNA synthetase
MSKSLKNFYTLKDIKERNIDPLALRYLFLTAHYRDKLNFTWESLQASQNALNNLREQIREWEHPSVEDSHASLGMTDRFSEALNNDLNTPQALAIMWELVKSDLPESEKAGILLEMDKVLGLDLATYIGQKIEVPAEVLELVEKRENAREQKDFTKSDELRKQIEEKGFEVLDTSTGPKLKQTS